MMSRQEALKKYGSDYQIKKHIDDGTLRKIDKGIYAEEKNVPVLAVITLKYLNAILTMDTAFYFHGLTDVIPDEYDLATGRNAPKIVDKKIRQYFIPEDFLRIGVEEVDKDDYTIRVYSKERMLIELLRFQSKLPFDYYKEILLNYRKRLPTMNIQKIQDYALSAPNSNKVFERLQMEVL